MANTYKYVDKAGKVQTIQANSANEAINNAPNRMSDSGVQLVTTAPPTQPTTAGQVNNAPNVNMPQTSTSNSNISLATSTGAGANAYWDQMMKEQEAERQRQLAAIQGQAAQNQSMMDKLLGNQKSRDQIQAEKEAQLGINTAQSLANIKAKEAELKSLTADYEKAKKDVETQIESAFGKMGSMNFINNQVAQIRREAAPFLNNLAANVNMKAAEVATEENDYARAQNLIDKAVENTVADQKDALNMFKTFYDMNQDAFDRMDSVYVNAYKEKMGLLERQYNEAKDTAKTVLNMSLEYSNAGILPTDSMEEAVAKVKSSDGGVSKADLMEVQGGLYNIRTGTWMVQPKATTGDDEKSSLGLEAGNFVDQLQAAINSGMSASQAAVDVVGYLEDAGIKTDTSFVNQLQKLANGLKKGGTNTETSNTTTTPSVQGDAGWITGSGGTGGWFGNLFKSQKQDAFAPIQSSTFSKNFNSTNSNYEALFGD